MFKKVSDENLMNFLSKNHLDKEKYSFTIKTLINIRNDFIHYMPKGWTILLDWIDKIIVDILDMILILSNNQKIKDKVLEIK